MSPWLVVLIGIAAVFAGLAMIILAVKIMTLFTGAAGRKEPDLPAAFKSDEDESKRVFDTCGIPHNELVAASAVAIAESLGGAEGLRVHSIRRIDGADGIRANKLQNVAIAAAIAESMAQTPDGLRILSIKQI